MTKMMNRSNGGWKKKKRWDIHAMLLDVSYCRRNGISYINNWSAGIKYEWSASLHNSSDWIMGSARLCPTSPKMLHRVCGSKLSSHSVDFYFPFSRWHWLNRREKKKRARAIFGLWSQNLKVLIYSGVQNAEPCLSRW